MPMPITNIAMVAAAMVLMPKRWMGTIGTAARRSTATNSSVERAETPNRASTRGLVQPSSPPKLTLIRPGISIGSSSAVPSQSKRSGRRGGRSQGIFSAITSPAMGPTKNMIQKTQRQEMASVRTPPSGAPITPERAKMPANRPMYLPRSEAGKRSPITEKVEVMITPAPAPCRARKAISS